LIFSSLANRWESWSTYRLCQEKITAWRKSVL